MRAAASLMALSLTLAGCNDGPRQAETNNESVTEVEALPPDESVDIPADEPANGAAEPGDNSAAQE